MIESSSGLTEQLLYGHLQDAEARFEERDPNRPHKGPLLAGREAARLCAELADLFRRRGEDIEFKLAEYESKMTFGD